MRRLAVTSGAFAVMLVLAGVMHAASSTVRHHTTASQAAMSAVRLGYWRLKPVTEGGKRAGIGGWLVRTSRQPQPARTEVHALITLRGRRLARTCVRLRVLGHSASPGMVRCIHVGPKTTRRVALHVNTGSKGPAVPEIAVRYFGTTRHVAILLANVRATTRHVAAAPQSGTGFWSDPVPATASADPNSTAMINLLAQAATQGFVIAAQKWSVPVYHADTTTPKTTISLTASWAPKQQLTGVPIPQDATPSPDSDGHLAIIDPTTNCEYDLWQAQKNPNGSWTASWANATTTTGTGWYPLSATGAGDALTAGLITPDDMKNGINHALKFNYPYTKAGGPVAPAPASDGQSTNPASIPAGARLQLDPTLNLQTLNLTPWQTTIAKALQTYGMYLTDTGGGVGLSAQENTNGTPYPWGNTTYADLPQTLITHLRVLTLPPQQRQNNNLLSTGCGVFS